MSFSGTADTAFSIPGLVLLAAVALFATGIGTGWVRGWLLRRHILDHPNDRSSHTQPTPRGGGLVVTPVVLLLWLVIAGVRLAGGDEALIHGSLPVIVCASGLLAISWLDDRRSLSARARFSAHIAAAALGLAALPAHNLVFQGWLPWGIDRAVTLVAWVWFINLFNFMDGIDGISGVETFALALGIGVIGGAVYWPWCLVLAGAALGFLVWNWHPAKIFLGDGGSIPLGYLLGWLLIRLAAGGQWAPALILPLYYLADATITLSRRALRGEKIWQAHRQHFYQRASLGRGRHDVVSVAILVGNLALIAAAEAAVYMGSLPGLAAGVIITGLLLALLSRWSCTRKV